jgi:hypothetical protein
MPARLWWNNSGQLTTGNFNYGKLLFMACFTNRHPALGIHVSPVIVAGRYGVRLSSTPLPLHPSLDVHLKRSNGQGCPPVPLPSNADEAGSWDGLHERFEVKRINHQEAYSMDGACTNWAEEFFSRMRRAEIGHHHHIAGAYLLRYAQEASWREDNRRASNGDQTYRVAGLAMKRKQSVDFTGYWQRHLGVEG